MCSTDLSPPVPVLHLVNRLIIINVSVYFVVFNFRHTDRNFALLSEIVGLFYSRLTRYKQENESFRRFYGTESGIKSRPWPRRLFRARISLPASLVVASANPTDDAAEDEYIMNKLMTEINQCHEKLNGINVALYEKCQNLDRDGVALVLTVKSFCREAILRESEKFVHDSYNDVYNRYVQAAGRERQLVEQLQIADDERGSLKSQVLRLTEELGSLGALSAGNTKVLGHMAPSANGGGNDTSEEEKRSNTGVVYGSSQASDADTWVHLSEENQVLRQRLTTLKRKNDENIAIIAEMETAAKAKEVVILKRLQKEATDADSLHMSDLQQQTSTRNLYPHQQEGVATRLGIKDKDVEKETSSKLAVEELTEERNKLFKENECLIDILRLANMERAKLKKALKKLHVKYEALQETLRANNDYGKKSTIYEMSSSDDRDEIEIDSN